MERRRILIFGGGGFIGSAVRSRHVKLGWEVHATSRDVPAARLGNEVTWFVCDPSKGFDPEFLNREGGGYSAVCWAQGANASDSIVNFSSTVHMDLYRANCLFVLETLQMLLQKDLLEASARMVIVSSIWQRMARPEKLSYMMSKAAIGGLVRSAAMDLASRGHLINAVLPSAIASEMTTKNLSPRQIDSMAASTGFGRLTSIEDLVGTIEFLCSQGNTGLTGQSITVDLGFSNAKAV